VGSTVTPLQRRAGHRRSEATKVEPGVGWRMGGRERGDRERR